MESRLELPGPDGRNPMGFFAALGALAAVTRMRPDLSPRLSWTATPIPRPVLHGVDDIDQVVTAVDEDRLVWAGSPALFFGDHDDVKFDATQQREYLLACRAADDGGRSSAIAVALVAEGAFAGKRDGKPTDLHFAAGQQRFLRIAQTLQREVVQVDLIEAIAGPWAYAKRMPTFGWDVSDDRVYALSASDPSKDTKFTVPGADWLGLLGLAAFPVVNDAGRRARPAGSGGSWKTGTFSWPLWSEPLPWGATHLLLNGDSEPGARHAARLGVFRVMQSVVRRSDQGGYGSFSPSTTRWELPTKVE